MTLIAIFFPFVSFFLRGRILTSIICLILQITVIGWIPAAIWAVISLQNGREDKHNKKLVDAFSTKRLKYFSYRKSFASFTMTDLYDFALGSIVFLGLF
ncbi:Proteolipid membrane potential modulator [Flavobacterium gillisiae]|uniref:Proteolipid membrane potential modulator n=1 Tax=Flavobacterium gillisiae TaxID=150146 RepID=A0A1H4FXD2_9FLAO|nr:YqaE/Pmp3 family membrane protein [Flavobacterium gillisiae]SEB02013.1 Proteolipid membrane potential modulator [Flavobacterium gillisiae]